MLSALSFFPYDMLRFRVDYYLTLRRANIIFDLCPLPLFGVGCVPKRQAMCDFHKARAAACRTFLRFF
jgi:hypothetical protein